MEPFRALPTSNPGTERRRTNETIDRGDSIGGVGAPPSFVGFTRFEPTSSTYTRWAWTNEGRFTVFAALLLVGLAGGIGGARVIGKRSEPGG